MRLRPEIVDFLRPGPLQQPAQGSAVGQIAMVQEEARGGIVGVLVNIVDSLRVECARPPNHAVHFIAFVE